MKTLISLAGFLLFIAKTFMALALEQSSDADLAWAVIGLVVALTFDSNASTRHTHKP